MPDKHESSGSPELTPKQRVENAFTDFEKLTDMEVGPTDTLTFDADVEDAVVQVRIGPLTAQDSVNRKIVRDFGASDTDAYYYEPTTGHALYVPRANLPVNLDFNNHADEGGDSTVALAVTLEELLDQVRQQGIPVRTIKQ